MSVINQQDVLNALHNLMGHRTNPGGTDDDFKRYIQASFDYCWRYYRWNFSLAVATIEIDVNDDALLPEDFDPLGYRAFDGITEVPLENTIATGNTDSAIIWDSALARYKLTPAAEGSIVYQKVPPTLGTSAEESAPFPSAMVVAVGATVLAKQGENPTRADIQQEWDEWHSRLDRLVAQASNSQPRTIRSYHDKMGTYVGDVGA